MTRQERPVMLPIEVDDRIHIHLLDVAHHPHIVVVLPEKSSGLSSLHVDPIGTGDGGGKMHSSHSFHTWGAITHKMEKEQQRLFHLTQRTKFSL